MPLRRHMLSRCSQRRRGSFLPRGEWILHRQRGQSKIEIFAGKEDRCYSFRCLDWMQIVPMVNPGEIDGVSVLLCEVVELIRMMLIAENDGKFAARYI